MHQKSLFGDQKSKKFSGEGALGLPPNPLTPPNYIAVSRIDAAQTCCVNGVENASCGSRQAESLDVVGGSTLTTVVCAGCRRPICDQFMLHIDPTLDWHASCLRCAECSKSLDETCTCFVRDGRAYCKPDYNRSVTVPPPFNVAPKYPQYTHCFLRILAV